MKSINIKFYFKDKEYNELEKLAERLDISTRDLISQFFTEGMSLSWDAFEYEAKKKDKMKALSKKYNVPIEELIKLKESLKE